MMGNNKYFGILKGFDFDEINKDNFQILIDNNLFDTGELSPCYRNDKDYFGIELDGNSWRFSDFFLFNRKEFYLKKEIYLEMYFKDKNYIEETSDDEFHISEIDFEIEKEIDTQKKLGIIEYHYKKYFSSIHNKELYLLYKNNTKLYGHNHFSDYYKGDIEADEDYSCIVKYLQGKETFYNKKLKEDWEIMFLVSKVCDFCLHKKQLIENPKFTNSQINQSKSIFIDDGYKIFSFLESKYVGKKNNAFFSYLYSFLQENNKIIHKSKDSVEYRNFIKENFKLDMSRIIETSANNQYKKDDIFKTFSNHMKSYSVND